MAVLAPQAVGVQVVRVGVYTADIKFAEQPSLGCKHRMHCLFIALGFRSDLLVVVTTTSGGTATLC